MLKSLCGLYDKVSKSFFPPLTVSTPGVFYRNVQDEIRRGGDDNGIATHTEDYEVWFYGTFDDETGEINSSGLSKLCDVASLVVKAN